MAQKSSQSIDIELSQEVAQGTYSNLVIISHNPTEMILDFAQMLPGNKQAAHVRDRIIMHPVHAKRLLNALSDNLQKYEQHFGPIIDPSQSASTIDSSPVPYDVIGKA